MEQEKEIIEIEEKYKKEFSYLGDRAYLNVCSVAMQPERTLKHCREFQKEFVDSLGEVCFGPYGERRYRVREMLGELIGASPEEILLTGNTTEGDCILQRCLDFQAGDSVILSDFDYPAVIYGWYQLSKQGVELQKIQAVNGVIPTEAILSAMNEHTKVVAISWVQYMSGFQADLKTIGQACRERGILFLVDGIQGLGRLQLDVKECNIDVLSCGAFKGMLGVFGAGFVYCRKELILRLKPWTWSEDNIEVEEESFPYEEHTGPLPYRTGMDRLQAGSMNTYGILALGTSTQLLLEIGPERIDAHVRALEEHFRSRIVYLTDIGKEGGKAKESPLHLLGSREKQYWSGLVCMEFAKEKLPELETALKNHKISATIRNVRGKGFLRIAIHYYNTKEHLDRLADTLQQVFREL